MFNLNELIEIKFFRDIYKSHEKNVKKINKEILVYQIIRDSIDLMVRDLIKNKIKNLKKDKIKSLKDIYNNNKTIVCFSNKFSKIEKEIKLFLRLKMYNNKSVLIKNNNGKKIINKLFLTILIKNNKIKKKINILFLNILKKTRSFLTNEQLKEIKYRAIADFISGMTDRYAINLYKKTK